MSIRKINLIYKEKINNNNLITRMDTDAEQLNSRIWSETGSYFDLIRYTTENIFNLLLIEGELRKDEKNKQKEYFVNEAISGLAHKLTIYIYNFLENISNKDRKSQCNFNNIDGLVELWKPILQESDISKKIAKIFEKRNQAVAHIDFNNVSKHWLTNTFMYEHDYFETLFKISTLLLKLWTLTVPEENRFKDWEDRINNLLKSLDQDIMIDEINN